MPSPLKVFINCPYDPGYREMFDAQVFAVLYCGFYPCSAVEAQGSAKQRFARILDLIRECPLGIHDLSRTELSGPARRKLPRFNMPLELGLFIGAREFSGDQNGKKKDYLVFEKRQGDCGICCTDLGGVDPLAHRGQQQRAVEHVRNWLNGHAQGAVPGPQAIRTDYRSFKADLPGILAEWKIKAREVTFVDFRKAAALWVKARAAG